MFNYGILLIVFLICLFATPCLAEPHWQYVHVDGVNMMIAPAEEMGRVERFTAANCPMIQELVVNMGGLKVLDKMSKSAYAGWWGIAIYLQPGQQADFQKGAKVIMRGVHKQDTVTVESEQILFALGWGFNGPASALNQRSPMSTNDRDIQVRCSQNPGINDFEWMIFDKDGEHYVIGWVSFPWKQVKDLKPVEFRVAGVKVYHNERR